jgi:ribosomal RNA-processing protein 1
MSRRSNDNDDQELEPERILVHKLVDSSKAQRTKAVERLKLWINARTLNPSSFFTYDDLIKIWKGLYYNMWMADKPILQVVFIFRYFRILFFCKGSTSFTSIIMDS